MPATEMPDGQAVFLFSELPPLSLYVHVPWCVRKCPYCDFNSHALKDALPAEAYVDALLADLEADLPRVWGRSVHSIFIGGGTPSLLPPEAVHRLLGGLRARLRLLPDAEITLEANPGAAEAGRFAEFRAAGVNRLSIGAQSFQDALLQRIGRIHGGRDAARAFEAAQRAGFENINLDLMFGLPGQSLRQASEDLATALTLAPSHLSRYQLTLEPNTAFHHSPPSLPDEDAIYAMQDAGQAQLAAAGFERYEISAYARPGARCRHNLNYWRFGDYLGIGAGAHGKITSGAEQRIRRLWKKRHPHGYLAAAEKREGENTLVWEDAAFEFMLNALRLVDGFEGELFSRHAGLALECIAPALEQAERQGLLERGAGLIRPTPRGLDFLNDLLALFLPEAAGRR